MSDITRGDLRAPKPGPPTSSRIWVFDPVSDEEFARLAQEQGYVHRSEAIRVQWCATHKKPALGPKGHTCVMEELTPVCWFVADWLEAEDEKLANG